MWSLERHSVSLSLSLSLTPPLSLGICYTGLAVRHMPIRCPRHCRGFVPPVPLTPIAAPPVHNTHFAPVSVQQNPFCALAAGESSHHSFSITQRSNIDTRLFGKTLIMFQRWGVCTLLHSCHVIKKMPVHLCCDWIYSGFRLLPAAQFAGCSTTWKLSLGGNQFPGSQLADHS